MCAGGVPERTVDHAKNVLEFALDMHDALEDFNTENNKNIRIRIGINTGSVVAGVIGTKKFSFDLWGDAVNVRKEIVMIFNGLGCLKNGVFRSSRPHSSQSIDIQPL